MPTHTPSSGDHGEKQVQNIQDGFLNGARKEKLPVTIYLVSGVKLTGRIRSFDKFSVVLEANHQEQLIFKQVLDHKPPVLKGTGHQGHIDHILHHPLADAVRRLHVKGGLRLWMHLPEGLHNGGNNVHATGGIGPQRYPAGG